MPIISNSEATKRAIRGGRIYRTDGTIANEADGLDADGRQLLAGSKVEQAFAITPSDAEELAHPTTAIYIGASGDLSVELISGDIITMVGLSSGMWHPISAIKVMSTGTDAGNILGAY